MRTGCPVELRHIAPNHLSYLDRISFFECGAEWVFTRQHPNRWSRNAKSIKVMELMCVKDHQGCECQPKT